MQVRLPTILNSTWTARKRLNSQEILRLQVKTHLSIVLTILRMAAMITRSRDPKVICNTPCTPNYVFVQLVRLQESRPTHFTAPLVRGDSIDVVNSIASEQVDEDSFASNATTVRQSSEERGEAEARQARSHYHYSADPHTDNLYHCPYESTENCPHKPTKLKCVYEYERLLCS